MHERATRVGWRIVLCLAVVLAACGELQRPMPEPKQPLHVGVTPDYPPLVFWRGQDIVGVEPDLARALAQALDRGLVFVPSSFDRLIPDLLAGRTDIVMSGLSITRARRLRIAFSEPYVKGGLMAMMRTEDAGKYPTPQSVEDSTAAIGVKLGTTGDAWVLKECPHAVRVGLDKPSAAPFELRNRRIDLFVHDGPAIAWLLSENEADFQVLREPLTVEYLAWGLRRDDTQLLDAVNGVLAGWKQDGTLDRILGRWLPYLDRVRVTADAAVGR